MTLQEAIEKVKRNHEECGEIEDEEICEGIYCGQTAAAIATILNAVVKGELKYE